MASLFENVNNVIPENNNSGTLQELILLEIFRSAGVFIALAGERNTQGMIQLLKVVLFCFRPVRNGRKRRELSKRNRLHISETEKILNMAPTFAWDHKSDLTRMLLQWRISFEQSQKSILKIVRSYI
jgi:hypothetical protein